MMRTATFTIVMPAYNAAATIGPAIRSVLGQTRGDFELVVIDDGSTDETAARVQAFESDSRVILVRQENCGLPVARNVGIAHGTGRLVSMLDSDDLWLPGYLEAMGAALGSNPDAGFAYTDAWLLDDETRRVQRASAMAWQDPPDPPPAEPESFLAELLRRNFVFTSATVRREVLEEVGSYRESLEAAEDYELWLRIAAHGYRGVRVGGRLAVYRRRAGSLSTDGVRMMSSLRDVAHLVAEEYDVPQALRALARSRMREFEAALGAGGSLSVRYRLRALLVRATLALLAPWLWHRSPPPELAAVFPELFYEMSRRRTYPDASPHR
jgi:glycosyltransferase involved in cell wall biosynthesis